MTFDQWWEKNKQQFVESSRPMVELARQIWNAGYNQHRVDVLEKGWANFTNRSRNGL
jgi:hypothetical protein